MVTIVVCQTSLMSMHCVALTMPPLALMGATAEQILSVTLAGVRPAVSACQGATQYVVRVWTTGEGVVVLILPEAMLRAYPYWLEKVTGCEHDVILIVVAMPCSTVAQTVVIKGE